MHAIALRRFILITAWLITVCLASVPALAGVGGTSAGVTTNIPGQSTDPSADVQAQSAGFVQQNQQLQNGATPIGIAVPASASGTAAGQGNAAGSPTDVNSKQKPGGADPANAQPVAPPPPPPPPPTYVSVVKHLAPQTPDTNSASGTAVIASVPIASTVVPPPAPSAQEKADPSSAAIAPIPVAPPRAAINRARADAADVNAEKTAATDHAVTTRAITGGRGEAPDGFAFYTGLGIALLLLAVALATYLRTQRDEAAVRSPR